jgi:hypothetical protein
MKNFLIAILAIVCGLSCSKVKGPANAPSYPVNNHLDSTVHIKATVNGYQWQTLSAYGYTVKNSANDSSVSNLMINAYYTNAAGQPTSMTFNITKYSGPNTYTINPPNNTATYYLGSVRHYATHGVLTIDSDTAYALRGSFYFTADTITVSNGEFDVALP